MTKIAAIAAVLLLCGCGAWIKTPYSRPALVVPQAWRGPTQNGQGKQSRHSSQHDRGDQNGRGGQSSRDGLDWWRGFGDKRLSFMVEQMLKGNAQAANAVITVDRARLQLELTDAGASADLSLGASARATRRLGHGDRISRGVGVDGAIRYDVDLWGGVASEIESARWHAKAAEQDRDGIVLHLVGATLKAYWGLGYLARQLSQSTQAIAHARALLELARVSYRAGAISAMDRLDAEQWLASQQSQRLTLLQEQRQLENTLAILLGQPAGIPISVTAGALDGPIPRIAAGLPADVLARRPDVRAAEMRLRAALNDVDGAHARFYPRLTLTGSAGSSSEMLRHMFENPVASVAASLIFPFMNRSELRTAAGITQLDYEAAEIAFRQTYYEALREVDDALSARDADALQADLQARIVNAAIASEQRYRHAYRAGAIALQTLLDAEQRKLTAQTGLANVRLRQRADIVDLYEALGGGDILYADRL